MKSRAYVFLLLPLLFAGGDVAADTYKCVVAGKSVYSDVPCASTSVRVDASSDNVNGMQKREAEIINQSNRRQLSELEYRSAVERNSSGKALIVESAMSPQSQPSARGRNR